MENIERPTHVFSGMCPSCGYYNCETHTAAPDDGGISLIGEIYQPSPAIRALIAYVTANPTWSVGERYRITVLVVVAIRAERPDWSDVQARDWLREQLRKG